MSRYLYLVRHGEQQDAEHGMPDGPLSDRGKQQASLIAERLKSVPLTDIWYSPLQRAEETARVLQQSFNSVEPQASTLLLDCVPSGPVPGMPTVFDSFYGGISEAELAAGSAQMQDAMAEWLSPSLEDKHELLVTHNFVISWFVREVLDAPAWRWLSLSQANCGLTIIRARTTKPHNLICHNDLGHLPAELRTGLSIEQPY